MNGELEGGLLVFRVGLKRFKTTLLRLLLTTDHCVSVVVGVVSLVEEGRWWLLFVVVEEGRLSFVVVVVVVKRLFVV